jgi:hypothetical protein
MMLQLKMAAFRIMLLQLLIALECLISFLLPRSCRLVLARAVSCSSHQLVLSLALHGPAAEIIEQLRALSVVVVPAPALA